MGNTRQVGQMSLRHKRTDRVREKLGSRAAVLDERTSSQPSEFVRAAQNCWLRVSEEGSGFAMFAPPSCRRRRRNDASLLESAVLSTSFRRMRRSRRLPGGHRSERSEPSNTARSAHDVRAADLQEEPTKRHTANGACRGETVVSSDPTKTAAIWRTSQRAERAIERSELVERGNSI
jgi:hypothetical protein